MLWFSTKPVAWFFTPDCIPEIVVNNHIQNKGVRQEELERAGDYLNFQMLVGRFVLEPTTRHKLDCMRFVLHGDQLCNQ